MGNSPERAAFHWKDIVYAETRTTPTVGDGENLKIAHDLAGVIYGILRREVNFGRRIGGFEELQASKNPIQTIVDAIRQVLSGDGNGSKETVPEGCVRAIVTRFFDRHAGAIATPATGGKTLAVTGDSRIPQLKEGQVIVLRPDGRRDEMNHPTARLVQVC